MPFFNVRKQERVKYQQLAEAETMAGKCIFRMVTLQISK
jgi:hypothetical protein